MDAFVLSAADANEFARVEMHELTHCEICIMKYMENKKYNEYMIHVSKAEFCRRMSHTNLLSVKYAIKNTRNVQYE